MREYHIKLQEDRQITCNVTRRRVRETIAAVEKQKLRILISRLKDRLFTHAFFCSKIFTILKLFTHIKNIKIH